MKILKLLGMLVLAFVPGGMVILGCIAFWKNRRAIWRKIKRQ